MMEKKGSVGVKLVTILVLSVFCLVLSSCGAPGGNVHKHPEYFKVGIPAILEIEIFPSFPFTWARMGEVKCYFRLTGEKAFKIIPMFKAARTKNGYIYKCVLPPFTLEQKKQFGSVEYYLDFYLYNYGFGASFKETSYIIRDYTSTDDFGSKIEEAKKKGEDVVVINDRAYKFSLHDTQYSTVKHGIACWNGHQFIVVYIEHPIPYRIPLVE